MRRMVQLKNPIGSTKPSNLLSLDSLASLSLSLLSLTRFGLELIREVSTGSGTFPLGAWERFKAKKWPKGASCPLNRLIFFLFLTSSGRPDLALPVDRKTKIPYSEFWSTRFDQFHFFPTLNALNQALNSQNHIFQNNNL